LIEIPRPPADKAFFLDPPKPAVEAINAATKLITSWITYTNPLADAIESGVHAMFIPPGPDVPDMLIRTIGEVDLKKMEREHTRIAELWSEADEFWITSDLGTDLRGDISGIGMRAPSYPPGKPERGKKWMTMTPWGQAGGSCRSIEGKLVVNGCLGSRHVGVFGVPSGSIEMDIEDNMMKNIKGDTKIWPLWKAYLNTQPDPNNYGFPAHGPGVGLNPNARLGGPAEWERLRGNITFGCGDNSVLNRYWGRTPVGPVIEAKVHWDLQILGASMYLDDILILENGEVKI
jgi:hypothetical protein